MNGSLTGLEQHEGELSMTEFKFLGELFNQLLNHPKTKLNKPAWT